MAQRISRAKQTVRGRDFTEPGDLAVVLRVLSLVYHAGHGRPNDLADDAIRLARQLTLATTEPEARGLLALMLLQHARLPARTDANGRFVPLDEQDRSLWDTAQIAEGVAILQGALGEQRHGRYQIQAAIAALHADASTSQETDWSQILEWYDDLIALSDDPDRDDPAGGAQPGDRRRARHGCRGGAGRDRAGGATCSVTDSSGTPSVPTCSRWAASSRPPATPTRLPLDAPTRSLNASTSSAGRRVPEPQVGCGRRSECGTPLSPFVIGVGCPKNPSTRLMSPDAGSSVTTSSPSIRIRSPRIMSHRYRRRPC